MATLSIVIPAYNEERGIDSIISRVLAIRREVCDHIPEIEQVEIIVVNDASHDRTAQIAASFPEVHVISHQANRGYGTALKTGFRASRGEYLAFLDADGTYPPEAFPRMCRTLVDTHADMVIGSRFGGEQSSMPVQRYIGNKVFAYLLSWIVGRRIHDTASGMRILRRTALERLLPLPDGLHFTPAMSTRALHEGMHVVEVPISYAERLGRSKLNAVVDGVRFLRIIVATARLYNPLKFFGAVGAILLLVAVVLGIDPVVYYLRVRRVEDTEIYRLFSIMVLLVTGLNIINFGAFANYVLEIVHGRELRQHSLIGQYLLRRSVVSRFGLIGLLLMCAAAVLNYRTILEYVTTRRIYVHWSYAMTGATLFLVGLQLAMGSVLINILEELKETPIAERWASGEKQVSATSHDQSGRC